MTPVPDSPISSESLPGSPDSGEPGFLVVGKLLHPHGVRGEIVMAVYTDFPERIHAGVELLIGSQHITLKVRGRRWHQDAMLVSFRDLDTPEAVGVHRNQMVYVSAADRPELPDGELYHHQVVGLQVVSDQGEDLGRVTEILETGANDILVVRGQSGPELLLPFIDSVILKVDLQAGRIYAHLLPGLRPNVEG